MKEEQAEVQEQEHEELGVYLLDIAASTFAIMLIYLLMVASQASDVQQQKVETSHYKPKDRKPKISRCGRGGPYTCTGTTGFCRTASYCI